MFMFVTRWLFYFIGLLTFSYGITIALSMQHLGIHPWDVLAVALFEKFGVIHWYLGNYHFINFNHRLLVFG